MFVIVAWTQIRLLNLFQLGFLSKLKFDFNKSNNRWCWHDKWQKLLTSFSFSVVSLFLAIFYYFNKSDVSPVARSFLASVTALFSSIKLETTRGWYLFFWQTFDVIDTISSKTIFRTLSCGTNINWWTEEWKDVDYSSFEGISWKIVHVGDRRGLGEKRICVDVSSWPLVLWKSFRKLCTNLLPNYEETNHDFRELTSKRVISTSECRLPSEILCWERL